MVSEVTREEEIEGDHGDEVEGEPGFDVVERDGVDVGLHLVGLGVDVLLAEAEEDVENEEDFHRVVDDELLERCRNAESGVVGIHDDGVGGKDEDEQVEDIFPGRLPPDDKALEERVLLWLGGRPATAFEGVVFGCREGALGLIISVCEDRLVLNCEEAVGALVLERLIVALRRLHRRYPIEYFPLIQLLLLLHCEIGLPLDRRQGH